ncbi:MAG: hypothetical protein R3C49_13575 [Planctomycetaceae bacterium]
MRPRQWQESGSGSSGDTNHVTGQSNNRGSWSWSDNWESPSAGSGAYSSNASYDENVNEARWYSQGYYQPWGNSYGGGPSVPTRGVGASPSIHGDHGVTSAPVLRFWHGPFGTGAPSLYTEGWQEHGLFTTSGSGMGGSTTGTSGATSAATAYATSAPAPPSGGGTTTSAAEDDPETAENPRFANQKSLKGQADGAVEKIPNAPADGAAPVENVGNTREFGDGTLTVHEYPQDGLYVYDVELAGATADTLVELREMRLDRRQTKATHRALKVATQFREAMRHRHAAVATGDLLHAVTRFAFVLRADSNLARPADELEAKPCCLQ